MSLNYDAHIHMGLPTKKITDDEICERLKGYADAGITFLRDGGDNSGISLRAKQLSGMYGVDYRTPAFAIHRNGHYGSFLGKGFDDMDGYKALVDNAIIDGADFIKIIISFIYKDVNIPTNSILNIKINSDNFGAITTMDIDIKMFQKFAKELFDVYTTLKGCAQLKETYGHDNEGWFNKIFWGDNLQVMSHLLKEYRGKVDLIYIDPPFDSKADYKKKIKVKGKEVSTDSLAFEEKQYGDIWTNDEYLQFMYERLILCKELLYLQHYSCLTNLEIP